MVGTHVWVVEGEVVLPGQEGRAGSKSENLAPSLENAAEPQSRRL